MKKEAGHKFLAKLGKTKLRPGGIEATNWLLDNAKFNSDTKILEVACNMGTTMINLSKKYNCSVIGMDMDKNALEKAKKNISANGLEDKLSVIEGNALKLPFEDNSFDVVINEAMLTMLPLEGKKKAVSEYYRVLKTGGQLLTHDVMLTKQNDDVVKAMQEAINVNATPLVEERWKEIFKDGHFKEVITKSGEMSLMSPMGMIRDEGFFKTLKIIKNALKSENREMFKKMFNVFKKNKKILHYIAVRSVK